MCIFKYNSIEIAKKKNIKNKSRKVKQSDKTNEKKITQSVRAFKWFTLEINFRSTNKYKRTPKEKKRNTRNIANQQR